YEETIAKEEDPQKFVLESALAKINHASVIKKDEIVIAADTIVYFENEIIGKPKTMPEAFQFLKRMSGECHSVYTGMAVKDGASGEVFTAAEETKVYFAKFSDTEIETYLDRIDPLDKAGAYAIQGEGALIVERIEGCYYNVMGLPLVALRKLLIKIGVDLLTA
ncbi:Maf family protein, partial [Candidatus Auribacterota bacterium]